MPLPIIIANAFALRTDWIHPLQNLRERFLEVLVGTLELRMLDFRRFATPDILLERRDKLASYRDEDKDRLKQ